MQAVVEGVVPSRSHRRLWAGPALPPAANPVTTATSQTPRRAAPSGARSGALIAGASLIATGLNYAFLLAAGRLLGTKDYGALAVLFALLTVVLLPTGAVQLAVSREVSRRLALADELGADAFGRATLRLGLLVTVPLVAAGLLLVIPLRSLLDIESTAAVALAVSGLGAAFAYPIATGILQGFQRFHAVAVLYVLPFALRVALLALVASVGYRLGGAVAAAALGGIASAAVAIALLREPLRRGALASRPALGPFLRYLWPVVVGLIGIAVLTNIDLLIVKARFAPGDAGEYAAASAFARVAFFLPATILAVLFPRTAARQARGEETEDILGRALIVTAGFCGLLTLFYAMTGRGLVHTSFGGEFAPGGELLVLMTVAMSLLSLANVLVGFHLSRGERRFAFVVALAVPVQIAALSLLPTSIRGVLWMNIAVGAMLLLAHELVVGSSVPALRAGFRHLGEGVDVPRRAILEGVLVVTGAVAFVCVLFLPVVVHLGSTIVGSPGSDSTGSVWWFWRALHEGGFHLLGTVHHTLTGAPFGWDEGNGLNAQWLLPYYPTYLVAKIVGEVAAYNLAVLSGYVLSGVAMYALVRYVGCARAVAAWAGFVFVLFPWHVARAEHASLVHLEVLVLLLIALVAAARSPSWRRYALVGAATLACWLTSGYFGTMAVITTVAFSMGAALTMRRREGVSLVLGSTVMSLAASAPVGLAAVVSGVGRGGGLERMPGDLYAYGLRIHQLLVVTPGNLVFGDWVRSFHDARLHGSSYTEASTYVGLVTVVLAVGWVVVALRRRATVAPGLRSATAGLVAAVTGGVLFGLPSPVSVFGRDVLMPSRLVWEITPAFRVPSRWITLVMAALVPLAALGLQAAWRALGRRNGRAAQIALVVAAFGLSFAELIVTPAEQRFRTEPLPPEYAALERTPRGVVADYPLGSSDLYLLWQRRHGRPLLNGAPAGTQADEARRVLLDPSTPGVAEALRFLGVTAILVHPDGHADVEVPPREPGEAGGFALVARLADGTSVWRVVADPAPALVTMGGGFAPPAREGDGDVGFALVAPSGVGVMELTAREAGVVRLVFDARPPAGGQRTLRMAGAEQETSFTLDGPTQVSVDVAIPRGRSFLEIKTDPAATSEEDAVVIGVPRAERTSTTAQLQATPISADPGL